MFQAISLSPSHPSYPKALQKFWHDPSLQTLSAIGNLQILENRTLAIFCSVQCPGDLILHTYDFARALRDTDTATISGFHSPMEKECLNLLQRGTQPILYCPARSLEKMRLLRNIKTAIDEERLLLLSPFTRNQHRVTASLAQTRNYWVTALADAVFIAYATPGSKTEALAKQTVFWGKPLLTFDSPDTQNLRDLGAQVVDPVFTRSFWTHIIYNGSLLSTQKTSKTSTSI
ncbi:MAG: DNA-processing protein DprA [Cyanobacteria bacterium P01_F01_bin.56]